MKRAARGCTLFSFFLSTLFLTGCGERVSWNQKITINVETPDGIKSGSSVTRVVKQDKAIFGIDAITPPEARGVGSAVLGEAVVVDLGEGQYLFGLISGMDQAAQCAIDWGTDRWWPDGARTVSKFEGVVELPVKCQPRLVTFDDINDPASVKRVKPDDLAASFGDNYLLQSITLEMTNEAKSESKVEAVLGWWCDYKTTQKRLSGSSSIAISTNELADNLGSGSFKIGACK